MATFVTDYFKLEEGRGNVILSATTEWNCSLLDSTFSTSSEAQLRAVENWADVSSSIETSGTNYSATSLTNIGWYDGGDNKQKLSADDVSWLAVTITSYGACIWRNSDGLVMGFIDFGTSYATSNGTFTINWNTNGIFNKI